MISIGTVTNLDQELDLNHGLSYRVNVRAIDLVDNTSAEVSSDGVTIDTLEPVFTRKKSYFSEFGSDF